MSIASIYYKDANVVILVLDVDNQSSLERAEDYLEKIREETQNTNVILAVNKIDLL